MQPVTLTTPRLRLRVFDSRDTDAVYLACQDPGIRFYTPAPTPYRRADAEQYVDKKVPAGWADDTEYALGAFRADGGALVGSFVLIRRLPGVLELGYWTAPDQRGHGFAVEAAKALCDWGFATLGAHRIEWWAMVGNTASRAVAERLGFTMEGMLRRRLVVDGEPRDWWVAGLLKA
ncbi:MAG TPA: GNAT family protein [Actinophytocola sp.]|uniref:GNAT family N-acetyltransferase n=1 Tax=Actinophytocola sp. TaxID=1872138 RepID=UPI002F91FE23